MSPRRAIRNEEAANIGDSSFTVTIEKTINTNPVSGVVFLDIVHPPLHVKD